MTVAETIAGAALLWEIVGSNFADEIKTELKQRWQQFGWKKAAENYLLRLYDEHSVIRPLGSSAPIPLDKVFTDVYILPEPLALRRFNIHDLRADPGRLDEEVERLPGLELVQCEGNERLFILGGPGAGKTTFLKYLTIQAIQRKIEKIPIFLSLKRWADSEQALMDYIVQEFAICAFPDAQMFIEHILQKGRALVLFDGLDEIPQAESRRDKAIDALRDFARQYHASPCLITCRRAAVEYTFTHFTYVEMADFNDAQIRDLVTKWFADDPEKSSLFFADFERAENRGVRELARTPLLLTLLCLAFEQNASFPQRRVEIYRDAIEALLRKWDASRNIRRDDLMAAEELYKVMSPDRKHQMLSDVAIKTFIKGDYFIDQETLEKLLAEYVCNLPGVEQTTDVDGQVILQAIEAQHGILVTRAHQIHSFAHLSFQEYFAAMAIKEQASAVIFERLLQRFLIDNRWREVFLLTASALQEANVFLTTLRCAVDNFIADDATLEAMAHWVDQQTQASPVDRRGDHIRGVYWGIIIARALISARARDDVSTHALISTHAHISARTLISARARDDVNTHTFIRALANITIRLVDSIARDNARAARAIVLFRVLVQALFFVSVHNSLVSTHNLTQELAKAETIKDQELLYDTLTRLLPDVYTILIEILHQAAMEQDYPLLRDESLMSFVPDLTAVAEEIYRVSTPELVQAFGAYLAALATWSRGCCYPGLDTALAALTMPNTDADAAAWAVFLKQIEQLPQYIDSVIDWRISAEQAERLDYYFAAVNLLEECLGVAYATNRDDIRTSLWLPPGMWQPDEVRSDWGL